MRITASWLLLLVKVLKVSESASLPKQVGGRPSTLASVLWGLREGAWGTGPPSLLQHLLPRGLLEPCRRNAWPLSELPAPPGNTDSPVRAAPHRRGSRLYKAYRGDARMSRGQTRRPSRGRFQPGSACGWTSHQPKRQTQARARRRKDFFMFLNTERRRMGWSPPWSQGLGDWQPGAGSVSGRRGPPGKASPREALMV